jgi:hypothetical protein
MQVHFVKTWKEEFEAVERGDMHLQIRENDRYYEAGDLIVHNKVDPTTKQPLGQITVQKIILVAYEGAHGLQKGYVAMSVESVSSTHSNNQ